MVEGNRYDLNVNATDVISYLDDVTADATADGIVNAKFQSSTVAVPTPTPPPPTATATATTTTTTTTTTAVILSNSKEEGKEPEDVSSILNSVAAAADVAANLYDNNLAITDPVIRTDIVSTKAISLDLNVAAATAADQDNDNDDIDNAELQFEYENLNGDLDGYSPTEYINFDEYVNTYNSTTNKTKLMILETHRVNNNNDNSIDNEADVGNDGVLDDNDNYGVIYDRTDNANPPSLTPESNMPCIHSIIEEVNKDFKFWIDISNVKSTHDYGDNDDNNGNGNTFNDTVLNQVQVDSNNKTINLDEYNTISPIEQEINKGYPFWKTGKDFNNDFSHNNNHNQDLDNCYDDHYCVHSELIDSNPSMIPNNGERVVLFSSVSRVEKNVMVKNEVMSGRLFQSVYRVNSNINLNKILQIVLLIFLQVGCEWTLKKYRVDNDTKMDWILKWY